MSKLLRINKLEQRRYAEPFAGGCGLALTLLFEGYVSNIHINDVDSSIWAFWWSVLNDTEELARMVHRTPITVAEWRRQRAIREDNDISDPTRLGFATFFLNRTNRSGIIKGAGVIGGLEQNGKYKLDCRFNRDDLIRRIRRVAKYKTQVHLTRMDALDFLLHVDDELPDSTFLCIDPPYFQKGQGLYTSFYEPDDHGFLANAILACDNPWIVTYDKVGTIGRLYKSRRQYEFDITYSVETKRTGTELLIASKGLRLPSEIRERQVNRPQYRTSPSP